MNNMTFAEDLMRAGYKVKNAKITNVDLSMADHGCLDMSMTMDGGGWGCVFGGYALGNGYLGADTFRGTAAGLEYIMRVMDIIGVEKFNQLKGKYARCVFDDSQRIVMIGHITSNKWFDPKEFFDNHGRESNE